MLMNVLASGLLFLVIGPFKHVSSGGTKETGVTTSPVREVYIALNDTLELNCSINVTRHTPTQLGWKHDALNGILLNFTRVLSGSTIQLRRNCTQYDDAGVYECGLFNSSKFHPVEKVLVLVGEKPKVISVNQFNVAVYGKPVLEVIVEWPTLQANVTNELLVGRVPAGQHYVCEFNHNTSLCRRTPEFQDEMLSCSIGTDVLTTLFLRNELLGNCSDPRHRCTRLCAKVLVRNSFGVSVSHPGGWNLLHDTHCPPPRNLTVSFGEHHLTARWQSLPVHHVPVDYYDVKCFITTLLTGKTSDARQLNFTCNRTKHACWSTVEIKPFAWYNFTAACSLDFEMGPTVYTEVTTKEAAPSEAPSSCEVNHRSRNEAFVSWKVPSISTWNGKPNKFLVYYGDKKVAVNTSLAELHNRSATPGVNLTYLDPGKNYTVRVAMCTAGGCGERSKPCFILENTEDDSDVTAVTSPDHTGIVAGLVIAIGVLAGLILVAILVALMIRRQRSQRRERPSLTSILGPLNNCHPYEDPIDEGPSFCEGDQYYDTLDAIIHRRLLANVDGAVANLPVSEI